MLYGEGNSNPSQDEVLENLYIQFLGNEYAGNDEERFKYILYIKNKDGLLIPLLDNGRSVSLYRSTKGTLSNAASDFSFQPYDNKTWNELKSNFDRLRNID